MEAVGFEAKALEYAGHINVWTGRPLGMVVTRWYERLFLVRKFKLILNFRSSVERHVRLWPGYPLAGRGVCRPICQQNLSWSRGLVPRLRRFVTRMDRTIDDAWWEYAGFGCSSSAFDQELTLYVLGGFPQRLRAAGKVEQGINEAYDFLGRFSQKVFRAAGKVEEGLNTAYSALGKGSLKACENLDHLDQDLDSLYKSLGLVYTRAASKLDVVEQKVSQSLPRSKQAERRNWIQDLQRFLENPNWNISNLNVEAIIVPKFPVDCGSDLCLLWPLM